MHHHIFGATLKFLDGMGAPVSPHRQRPAFNKFDQFIVIIIGAFNEN